MNKDIFISYSWADNKEEGESREAIVDLICNKLESLGLGIRRDKKHVHYKDNIKAFENRLGAGDYIILIVSDKFLKSNHCMYEVLKIREHQEMYKRVFPIVLADAKIHDKHYILDCIDYWNEKIEMLESRIKRTSNIAYITSVQEQLRIYSEILRLFDDFTEMLDKMNTLSPDIHKETDFSALLQALEKQMKTDELTPQEVKRRETAAQETAKQEAAKQSNVGNTTTHQINHSEGDLLINGNKNVTYNYGNSKPPTGE